MKSFSDYEHDAFFGKNLSVYQPTTATTDTPNFRALCAELTKWLTLSGNPPREVIDRALTALATPPPSKVDLALKSLEGMALPEDAFDAISRAIQRLKELEGRP